MRPTADSIEANVRWLHARNGAASAAPAYAVLARVGSEADGTLSVNQPTTDGEPAYLNGPFDLPAGGAGPVTGDWPALALYEAADGTPAAGETWGAGAGSWKLRKDVAGFRVVGDPDTELEVVQVEAAGAGGDASGGGVTGSACGVGPSWLGALKTTHCLKLTVLQAVGECACFDTGQVFRLAYDGGEAAWLPRADIDPQEITLCTGDFSIRFVPNPCGPPCLSLAAGETTYNLQFGCGGDQYATFGGGGPAFCDGTEEDGGPKNNLFRVKVEWEECRELFAFNCPTSETPETSLLPRALYVVVVNESGGAWCDDDGLADGTVYPLFYSDTYSTDGLPVYLEADDDPAALRLEFYCDDFSKYGAWAFQFAGTGPYAGFGFVSSLDPFYAEMELPFGPTTPTLTNGYPCDDVPGYTGQGTTPYKGLIRLKIVEAVGQAATAPPMPAASDDLTVRIFAGANAGDHVGTYDAVNDWWDFGELPSLTGTGTIFVAYYTPPGSPGVIGTGDGEQFVGTWNVQVVAAGIPSGPLSGSLGLGANTLGYPPGGWTVFVGSSDALTGSKAVRLRIDGWDA